MEPRSVRMRGGRAPHRRTAHTAHPHIGVRGRRGQPHAPGAPVGHPRAGEGWSADRGEPRPRHRTAPSLQACWLAVTLSNENAPTRFPASLHPHPPACGPQRAAQGPARRASGRCSSLHWHRCRAYAASGRPFTSQIPRCCCSCPRGASRRKNRGRLAPRGSGAALGGAAFSAVSAALSLPTVIPACKAGGGTYPSTT
jgi:hypothetical protein